MRRIMGWLLILLPLVAMIAVMIVTSDSLGLAVLVWSIVLAMVASIVIGTFLAF